MKGTHTTLITASDKTIFYDYKKAKEIFAKLKVKQFSLKDLVLILLYAQKKPIHGRILLMKELFLLYEEILSEKVENPKFVPYRFGPYSFHLTELMSNLQFAGYLKISGRRNSRNESFEITKKGIKDIQAVYNRFPKTTRIIIERQRKGWDQLGTHGILNYVYLNYKKYKTKSLLKNKYKDIDWGLGTA